jgi:hypothetical protein
MKKTLSKVAIFGGAALLLSLPSVGLAKIVGQCSDCHTMHNSEQGQPVAQVFGWTGASPTPNEVLLKYDCMACHAMQTGQAIVTLAGGSRVPQVYGNYPNDRAGGNFAYIDGTKGSGGSDRKGHNVIDIVTADATLHGPPGFTRGPSSDQTNNTSIHTFQMASQFTCAGKAGCHGVRNQGILVAHATYDANGVELTPEIIEPRVGMAALTGAHHYDEGGLLTTADDISNSYRFLLGTYGNEQVNWANASASDHNEYYGENNVTFAPGESGCSRCHEESHGMETIGYVTNRSGTMTNFCETCHSNFHSSQDPSLGTTGAFLRHPSDFEIQNKTEYALMTAYATDAPVARTLANLGTVAATGGPGDIVMCLSCHSSHATDYEYMLRFDYTAIEAGNGASTAGCFVCHTTKDTGDGNTWLNPLLQ